MDLFQNFIYIHSSSILDSSNVERQKHIYNHCCEIKEMVLPRLKLPSVFRETVLSTLFFGLERYTLFVAYFRRIFANCSISWYIDIRGICISYYTSGLFAFSFGWFCRWIIRTHKITHQSFDGTYFYLGGGETKNKEHNVSH